MASHQLQKLHDMQQKVRELIHNKQVWYFWCRHCHHVMWTFTKTIPKMCPHCKIMHAGRYFRRIYSEFIP